MIWLKLFYDMAKHLSKVGVAGTIAFLVTIPLFMLLFGAMELIDSEPVQYYGNLILAIVVASSVFVALGYGIYLTKVGKQ